jgi:hypothetical protein
MPAFRGAISRVLESSPELQNTLDMRRAERSRRPRQPVITFVTTALMEASNPWERTPARGRTDCARRPCATPGTRSAAVAPRDCRRPDASHRRVPAGTRRAEIAILRRLEEIADQQHAAHRRANSTRWDVPPTSANRLMSPSSRSSSRYVGEAVAVRGQGPGAAAAGLSEALKLQTERRSPWYSGISANRLVVALESLAAAEQRPPRSRTGDGNRANSTLAAYRRVIDDSRPARRSLIAADSAPPRK